MKTLFLILFLTCGSYTPDENKKDVKFLIEKEFITKEDAIDMINNGTKVIISEIEIKLAEKEHKKFFDKKPFKSVKRIK